MLDAGNETVWVLFYSVTRKKRFTVVSLETLTRLRNINHFHVHVILKVTTMIHDVMIMHASVGKSVHCMGTSMVNYDNSVIFSVINKIFRRVRKDEE